MNRNVDVGRRALFLKRQQQQAALLPPMEKFSRRIYQQQHGLEIRYIDLRRIMNSFTTTSTTLNTFCNETGRSAMLSATNGKTTGAISETFVVYFPAIRLDHDYTFLWNRRNVSPKESKTETRKIRIPIYAYTNKAFKHDYLHLPLFSANDSFTKMWICMLKREVVV